MGDELKFASAKTLLKGPVKSLLFSETKMYVIAERDPEKTADGKVPLSRLF